MNNNSKKTSFLSALNKKLEMEVEQATKKAAVKAVTYATADPNREAAKKAAGYTQTAGTLGGFVSRLQVRAQRSSEMLSVLATHLTELSQDMEALKEEYAKAAAPVPVAKPTVESVTAEELARRERNRARNAKRREQRARAAAKAAEEATNDGCDEIRYAMKVEPLDLSRSAVLSMSDAEIVGHFLGDR